MISVKIHFFFSFCVEYGIHNKCIYTDYQQTVPFSKEVEILPGDEFVLECVYNSSNTTDMTFGGASTYDEMCLTVKYLFLFIIHVSFSVIYGCWIYFVYSF